MLNRLVPSTVLALLISEAVLIVSAYVLAAYRFLDVDPSVWLQYEGGALRIAIISGAILLGLYLQDLYSNLRIPSSIGLFQQVSLVAGGAFFLQALLSYVAVDFVLPKWVMMAGSLGILAVLPPWRVLYSRRLMKAIGSDTVVFLGTSDISRQLAARYAERPELNRVVKGFIAEPQCQEPVAEGPVLGQAIDFRRIIDAHKPDRVIVGMTERRNVMPVMDLLEVNFAGTPVEEAAIAFETAFGRVCSEYLRPSQLIFSRELGPTPFGLRMQTLYSFVIALAGVVMTAPLMLLTGIAVKLTSRGPVLFSQRRVGLHGRVFTLYKFRSMRADAEKATGAVWATRNDPRITPVGRFIRKTRLDELPQLINVLKGEMSIVGPRPERPEFVTQLAEKIPFYRQRHCVKPGITGWAQINHKYGDTLEDTVSKIEYDLYYIKHLSPALDFYIMFHTAKVMLLTRGAQ